MEKRASRCSQRGGGGLCDPKWQIFKITMIGEINAWRSLHVSFGYYGALALPRSTRFFLAAEGKVVLNLLYACICLVLMCMSCQLTWPSTGATLRFPAFPSCPSVIGVHRLIRVHTWTRQIPVSNKGFIGIFMAGVSFPQFVRLSLGNTGGPTH